MKDYDSEAFDGDSLNSAPLGQRLRSAREGTGLGIEEVASLLNLEESLIRALEDEDYEVLPSPIFIRGYLRAYAKLLRLDGNELIEVYGVQSGGMDPDLATNSQNGGSTAAGFPMAWLAGGTVTILLLVVVGWWFMSAEDTAPQMSQDESLSSEVVAEMPTDSNAIALPQQPKMTQTVAAKVGSKVEPKPVVEAMAESAPKPEQGTSDVLLAIEAAKAPTLEQTDMGAVLSEKNSVTEHRNLQSAVETMLEERQWAQNDGSSSERSVLAAPVAEPADSQVAQGVLSSIQNAIVVDQADAVVVVESDAQVEQDVAAVNKKVVTALSRVDSSAETAISSVESGKKSAVVQNLSKLNVGPVAPSGSDVLLLSSTGDSWAEVFDANGYRLLYDMLKVDRSKRLQGSAPFKVFLGNSPLVTLSLNDTAMIQKSFNRKNNTARFVVDVKGVRRR
ncbi:MAG: DUF4115 domain-containing protein [Gammaproteobacteria bacterium]|nr:DUF4115 domain-containing protein [Gammaproteobacteria bacterium]